MNDYIPTVITSATRLKVGHQYSFDPDCREVIKDQFGFYPPAEVTCFDVRETSIEAVRNGPYLEWAISDVIPTVGFKIPLTRYSTDRQVLREFRLNISDLLEAARNYRHRKETSIAKAVAKRAKSSKPKTTKKTSSSASKRKAADELVYAELESLGIF